MNNITTYPIPRLRLAASLLLVLGTQISHANPFTLRNVTSGDNGVGSISRVSAADFDGDGQTEWYAGGNHILKFPRGGTIQLPNLTLPGSPASVTPMPRYGVACDVDRDGDMDIVRLNDWNGDSTMRTLQVFLNNGSGGFSAGYRLDMAIPQGIADTGTHPVWFAYQYDMVAADFDADGDPDLALVTRYNSGTGGSVMIRMNDGSGNFTSSSSLDLSHYYGEAHIAAGDFDHDGDADLAVSGYDDGSSPDKIRIYRSNGDGSFTASIRTTLYWPEKLAFMDVNGDGWLDLVTNPSGSTIGMVHLNNQVGGFNAGTTMLSGFETWGDLNEDSAPDLLAYSGSGGSVTVAFRAGSNNGSYGAPENIAVLPVDWSSTSEKRFDPLDADGDGDQDVIVQVSTETQHLLYYIENRAPRRGGWAGLADTSNYPLAGCTDLEVADVNGDGLEDLLAVTPGTSRIHYLQGQANGFASAIFKYTAGEAAASVATGDWDGDGDLDLAYTLPASGKIRKAMQTNGSFALWADSELGTLAGASKMVTGSFSKQDGRPDLLVASTGGNIRWFYHQGDPAFWLSQGVTTMSYTPKAICAADSGSGFGDEVFCLAGQGQALQFRGLSFTPPWSYLSNWSLYNSQPSEPEVLAMAPMLDDGKQQAVFVDGLGRLVCWTPDASSAPSSTVIDAAPPYQIHAIAPVDWNHDGRPDLVCGTAAGLTFYLMEGAGWRRVHQYENQPVTDLVAIDFNHDGLMDVVGSQSGNLLLARNTGGLVNVTAVVPHTPTIKDGQTSDALSLTLVNAGRSAYSGRSADCDAALVRETILFRKAVQQNGAWVPGNAMSKAEIQESFFSASLYVGGQFVGSSGAGAVGSSGLLTIEHQPVLGQVVPLHPGLGVTAKIRLTLTSGASGASYDRFFVERYVSSTLSKIVTLDGASTPKSSPMESTLARTLVIIDPGYSPLEQWRQDHFGDPSNTGDGANEADYDDDGNANVIEYATGTDPTVPDTQQGVYNGLFLFPPSDPSLPLQCRVKLSNVAKDDPSLKVTIQQSSDMGTWYTMSTRTGGGSWSLAAANTVVGADTTSFIFVTPAKPAQSPRYFLRLKIEELP